MTACIWASPVPPAPPEPPLAALPAPAPPADRPLAPHSDVLLRLVRLIDRLRDPEGCPWDRAQTLESMRPHLLEEAHELLEAIDAGDAPAVAEELGDLLFNVLLCMRIAGDTGIGDMGAVAGAIHDKMRRRHPHIWPPAAGAAPAPDGAVDQVIAGWEQRKLRARGESGLLDGVPTTGPALMVAHSQGKRVAAVGFDWTTTAGVLNKVREELAELEDAIGSGDPAAVSHELGDVLMSLASLGRHLDTPAESALRSANQRFARRFSDLETMARSAGIVLSEASPAVLESLWSRAKSLEEG